MKVTETINDIIISEKPVSTYVENFTNIGGSGIRTYSVYEFHLDDFICLIPTYKDIVYTHLAKDQNNNFVLIGPKSDDKICEAFSQMQKVKLIPVKIFD